MEFKLPEIGEGVQEGELIRWLVKDGDAVQADQPLLEVMTDKATVEVPAPAAGKITALQGKEGQMIKVGQTLAQIQEGGAAKSEAASAPAAAPKAEAAPAKASAPAMAQSGGGQAVEFKLPEIGEGVQEGELIRWLVKDGDSVQADQPLLEVMTDKATVEVPAPTAGQISGLQAKDGQMIKVGQTLAKIQGGAAAPAAAAKPEAAAAPAATVAPTSVAAPMAKQSSSTPAAAAAGGNKPYVGALDALAPSSVAAAPIVRAMAQRAGIDLGAVPGSGPEVGGRNRVLEEDLLRYLAAQQSGAPATGRPAPSANAGFGEEVERKPLRGLRRVISNAMVKSKHTAPHYSYVDEFECSALVDLREEAKKAADKHGVKITYLAFIVKAVVGALKEFPVVNASLEDKPDGSQEVVYKKFYHIGIAVATDEGLLVPVIKHADKKSLLEIAREMSDLSARTRAGKAKPDELKGSTFTITSMGNIGGLFATPIINYPEAGILGVYKVQEKPLVEDGKIVIGKTMHLSLSLDHRIVDGAVGGFFCNAIIERLQNPAKMLLEMA